MDDHPDFCAEVPHPLVAVYLYWCPRLQTWTASVTRGTTDEPEDGDRVVFGPFDDAAFVAAWMNRLLGEAALLSLIAR